MAESRKFFVTGANGFTGSHVVKALKSRGMGVAGLVRQGSDLRRLERVELDLIRGDIGDADLLQGALAGVHTVIHTAAMVNLGISDAHSMTRVNLGGTRAVLDAARAAKVARVVHCSTIGVLGDTAGKCVDECHERPGAAFASPYDETKFKAEKLALAANDDGLQVVVVLPSGIMGRGDPHFGPALDLFASGRIPFWPALDRPTGIVHVEDLADLLLLAAEIGLPGARYIASAGEITPRQIFSILGKRLGRKPPRSLPEPAARAIAAILDPIGRLTGWNPPLSRERVHYLYDRCVRVRADRAKQELGWAPTKPEVVISGLLA